MTILNRTVVLSTATASSNGSWYPLDFRIDPGGTVRTFIGTLTTGDTIYLDLTNDAIFDPVKGTAIPVVNTFTVTAFTDTSFAHTLYGQWSAVRFRKAGETGPSNVTGIL